MLDQQAFDKLKEQYPGAIFILFSNREDSHSRLSPKSAIEYCWGVTNYVLAYENKIIQEWQIVSNSTWGNRRITTVVLYGYTKKDEEEFLKVLDPENIKLKSLQLDGITYVINNLN